MTVPVPPDPDVVPDDLPDSDDAPRPPASDEPHLDPDMQPPRIR